MTDAERKTYFVIFAEIEKTARAIHETASKQDDVLLGEIIGMASSVFTLAEHFGEKESQTEETI